MIKIAIGTKNPAKIKAAKNVLKKIWPTAKIVSCHVLSEISVMPKSDNEAIKGAINRAKNAQKKTRADFGIGMEGSVSQSIYGMFLCSWAVVVSNDNKIGIGAGGKILLPKKIAGEIENGKELGPLIDNLSGEKNTKQKQGAIGVLTNGLITRTESFETAIIYALARFINPKFYKMRGG